MNGLPYRRGEPASLTAAPDREAIDGYATISLVDKHSFGHAMASVANKDSRPLWTKSPVEGYLAFGPIKNTQKFARNQGVIIPLREIISAETRIYCKESLGCELFGMDWICPMGKTQPD